MAREGRRRGEAYMMLIPLPPLFTPPGETLLQMGREEAYYVRWDRSGEENKRQEEESMEGGKLS